MSKLTDYIGSQFGNPRGFVGMCCCKIMNIINNPNNIIEIRIRIGNIIFLFLRYLDIPP